MKKLSILIYSMSAGGAERVVSNLLDELVKFYEVHLIMMNDGKFYKIHEDVNIHYLENSKPFENGFIKLLKLPYLGLKYKNLCKKLKIDIHFAWMNRPSYIAAFGRLFGDKKPLIINECSTPSVLYAKSNLKSKINKFLIKWLYPKADFIYPNSLGNLKDLRDNFKIDPLKMKVLYNALNLDDIKEKSKEEIKQKKKFFLSVGRLDSGKNHELLIRAFHKLRNLDIDLLIIGDGVLKEYLQNLINELKLQNNVKLLGFDNNPYKYMSRCHAFVFVSLFEGFSNALIEALACGKLVITSDHKSGAKELMGDNEYGVLVGVNDLNATAKMMQKSIDEPQWVKIYEKNAIIRACFFDKNKIVAELINDLEGIYEKFN